MRYARVKRNTKETEIAIELGIEGKGTSKIDTPIGFLNHMLGAFSKHGLFDLVVKARGDIDIDQHHTVEDLGIVLGQAFKKALGDRTGINRAGYFVYPMDEALAVVAVDLGGRPYLQYEAEFKRRYCGQLDTDFLEDFFQGLVNSLHANVVVRMPYGRSDHHKIEATFKAFAKAMKMACSKDSRAGMPSTKGVIDDNNS